MRDASVADPCVPGYRIVSPLGVGGMASVYLAVQESLERHVALKVLAPALAANQEFAQRFLKEGQITARLSHPHLVTVFDIGQHGATYYLATEYLPGGTLRDRLEQGISVADALDVVCDIAKGLHFAHSAGFVHRDVKPGNVMFRASGTAVLVDFGIAKSMGGDTVFTQVGSLVGTPRYMSPEQIGAEAVDGRSDLYSLGVVLFELLTGKPPYDASEPITVALMHVTHALPQLPPALVWLQPLIDGLMAKDARARFASGEALVSAVEHLLAQAPGGMALRNRPEARQQSVHQFTPVDLHLPAALPPAVSDTQTTARSANSEPASSRWQASGRWIVTAAILVLLLVLGGAATWRFFLFRAGEEAARTDEVCRAAVAAVTTAVGQADLARAQAQLAAMPGQCSAHPQVDQARDDVGAVAERAASARNRIYASLQRGDVAQARNALGTLERIDRSASDLPELRKRLDQASGDGAGEPATSIDRAADVVPQTPVRKESLPNATARATPPSPSSPRPQSVEPAPSRRPSASPPRQQSQKCKEISLRAGLGEETAEERHYISENCR